FARNLIYSTKPIWLDLRTTYPELRQQLIGGTP
ncbi:TPA: hypothetical protein ACU7F5_005525, partial [Klebsiella pneumoniae]